VQPRITAALETADDVSTWRRLAGKVGVAPTREIPLYYRVSPRRLADVSDELDIIVGVPPVDARVEIREGKAVVIPAETGTRVDRRQLARELRSLPPVVEVPLTTLRPAVSTATATKAAARANQLLSGRRHVGIDTTVVSLTPTVLGRMLTFTSREGELAIEIDEAQLERRLRPLERLNTEPRDATWTTDGKNAHLVPGKNGGRVSVAGVARSLVTNLESTVHRARFVPVAPALTTAEARKLQITELVSEFTTEHPCCAPRVTNIHRAADLLDGTLLEPRAKFSLNDALGKRTRERGFVEAPQIHAGRLEDAVGGGISQIATTLFNAAFFAGLRLDVHQAHQFYISRYPMGREATVSWGGPELIFTNTWPAGILMRFRYTDTSITVQFYSSKLGRRVVTKTGEPYGFVQPRTYVSVNKALKPGERRVLQSAGPQGFTVAFTRKVFKDDVVIRDERFLVRYDPEHAFVEQGPKKKPAKPKKKPGTTAPGPGGAADPNAPTQPAGEDPAVPGDEPPAATETPPASGPEPVPVEPPPVGQ
jgi:vancomycin resistance protein YoaR